MTSPSSNRMELKNKEIRNSMWNEISIVSFFVRIVWLVWDLLLTDVRGVRY